MRTVPAARHRALSVLPTLSVLIAFPALSAQSLPEDSTPPPVALKLVFTGDINLGSRTLDDGLPADSGRSFFTGVDSLLRGDMVIGNFEGVLSDSGDSPKCRPESTHCYSFATPTWLAPRLVDAGFTHLNLANNHANDFGPDWKAHTEATFDSLGLRWYGPLERIVIQPIWVDSTPVVVGLIGFTTYPFAYNLLDLPRSRAVVDSIRRYVDVVVVTFHGGAEGAGATRVPAGPEKLVGEPRGDLRLWSRTVIDAGADVVVGHGPHVLRGIEFYRGKPIVYSLGNFATYRGFNLEGIPGITALVELEIGADGSYRDGRLVSLRQRPTEGPRPDSTGAALKLVRRLSRLDFKAAGAQFGPDGAILPPPGPKRKSR